MPAGTSLIPETGEIPMEDLSYTTSESDKVIEFDIIDMEKPLIQNYYVKNMVSLMK